MNQVDEARRKWFKLRKGGKRVRSALNFWWKVSLSSRLRRRKLGDSMADWCGSRTLDSDYLGSILAETEFL